MEVWIHVFLTSALVGDEYLGKPILFIPTIMVSYKFYLDI
jgi:hypothetical protein